MDYTSRYGLEYNPFIKNSHESLVETSQYREVLSRLNYLLQIKGFGLLTGDPGCGKTTSIRNWINTLNNQANKVIYVPISTLTIGDFYRHLASELGCQPSYRKSENFRLIQNAIERLAVEKKMIPIFVFDEANYMMNATLNDLKILFNFEMDSSNKAVILLAGLPQLNNTLRLNIHEPLRQRITMNYSINPLSQEEGKKYLLEKLKVAGSHQEVFSKSAVEAVISSTGGIPRMIDKIANASLLVGNSSNENIISPDTVMSAVNDTSIS